MNEEIENRDVNPGDEPVSPSQRLIERFQIAVTSVAEAEAKKHGMTIEDDDVISALSQCTYEYLMLLANDLDAFAKHANRRKVTVQDVFLAVRRNESLGKILQESLSSSTMNDKGSAKKKRT